MLIVLTIQVYYLFESSSLNDRILLRMILIFNIVNQEILYVFYRC